VSKATSKNDTIDCIRNKTKRTTKQQATTTKLNSIKKTKKTKKKRRKRKK
jgi:hypothetical protein